MKKELKDFLDAEGCYRRSNPAAVEEALARLGVSPHRLFADFYRCYEGAFGSDHIGFTLSDMVEGLESSIVEATHLLRETRGFLHQHWVISDMCCHSILVYDCLTDAVYDVNFEGGEEQLKGRTLEPSWSSFEAFLDFYFLGAGVDEPTISVEQAMPAYLEDCPPQ